MDQLEYSLMIQIDVEPRLCSLIALPLEKQINSLARIQGSDRITSIGINLAASVYFQRLKRCTIDSQRQACDGACIHHPEARFSGRLFDQRWEVAQGRSLAMDRPGWDGHGAIVSTTAVDDHGVWDGLFACTCWAGVPSKDVALLTVKPIADQQQYFVLQSCAGIATTGLMNYESTKETVRPLQL